ncbi:MAG: hypothetical protein CV087_05015 [Candidatus Brocadia sp. WS118]|nr:MAG: hypothetical protein CV087_05015 [Candidatus Brocadia sp. WS118]
MAAENTAWQLEEFVDSLVVELDKTRETLAVKAINKPLSYTVKEMALDLNAFPSYDGDQVKFVTAQPGQQGASKVTIQLGSITDQQVRATTKTPGAKGDVTIQETDVDKATKKKLRKLGVNTLDDLKQIEKKEVDLQKASDDTIDYRKLANLIQKSKRNQNPPQIHRVSLSMDQDKKPSLVIEGKNLAIDPNFSPVAVVNQTLSEVLSSHPNEIKIQLNPAHHFLESNELIVTCDPFAVVKVNVKGKGLKPDEEENEKKDLV